MWEHALFGSAVRSDFRQDSDIDVLIDLAPDTRIGQIALQQMRDEIARLFGRPVDLLTRGGLNRQYAKTEGYGTAVIEIR